MAEPVHVLLVEDSPGDARLLRERLRTCDDPATGFVIEHVTRLAHAIDRLRTGTSDVVLLDLSLPDSNGLATCTKLLAAVDHCPPVIVMTGTSDHSEAREAVAAGAQDYLVKDGVGRDLLVRSIQFAGERHRARHALERALARERGLVTQLQELDRLKNRFVAMASHELRTPLASIAGFATTLRSRWHDIDDDARLQYIGIIDDQGARLTRLVDDLLVLSRIESGSVDARPESIDLVELVQTVLARHEFDGRVEVRVAEGAMVVADRDHLEQMLVNYLSNAVKYAEGRITVESRELGPAFHELLVRDEGDGVPTDVACVLFEEFVRGRGHVESSIPGTGLGLSIVRGLARAQGGDAWYEPNEPRGSTFCLRLPVPRPAAGPA